MDEILKLASEVAKPFEGLFLKPYYDPVGYPTQGYGRLLSRQVWGPLGRSPQNKAEKKVAEDWLYEQYPAIDEHTAELWLQQDMVKATRAAIRLCPGASKPTQLAALADFAFNCGSGNLELSTLRRKVNQGDIESAANEFGRWVYARGVKLPGLVRRRNSEKQLFLS